MKTYKNNSPLEQLGIAPGQTGQADIPQEQEERMVERGSIEVVSDTSKSDTPAEGEGANTESGESDKTPEQIEAEKKLADEQEAKDAAAKAQGGIGGKRR